MRTFIGIFFVLAALTTSASILAAPSDNAYKNANDNASFKKGGKHDDDDNKSLRDRLDEELNDDDYKNKNKSKNKNKKKSGKK